MPEQSFEKHARYIPAYHFVAFPILIVNVFFSMYVMYTQNFSKTSIWNVLVAVALVLLMWYARTMPLTAQDRIIRLEERMRLQEKLPPDLRSRAHEIRPGHLVALRFASDEELPSLAERCLTGEFKTSKEIKRAIKNWRSDTLRV